MAIKYSCFISYRHGQYEPAKRFINDLYQALSGELELLVDQEVYLDEERLKGGNFYNEKLAEALCQSACMIMVYTPVYFSKEYPYCAREYKAMIGLEKERLGLLNNSNGSQTGFIIPVVHRSVDSLPAEISERRQYHDFSRFTLSERRMIYNPKFERQIKCIAQYVAERHESLKAVSDQLTTNCQEFSFPPEHEIRDWLEQITDTQPQRFPGRAR